MNWWKNAQGSGRIAYHATRSSFDQFDLSFAKDEIGMQMGEGYGHNKFYFAKDKERAKPQVGSGSSKILTVQLDIHNPISGQDYLQRLRGYLKTMSRNIAVDKLDREVKESGYDGIEDSWQLAVFDPGKISIVDIEETDQYDDSIRKGPLDSFR